jgi:hypothetical protein
VAVLLNGIPVPSNVLNVEIAQTRLRLNVNELPIKPRTYSSGSEFIDDTHVEIKVIAIDKSDTRFAGVLTYSHTSRLSGTEVNDLFLFDGFRNGTYFTYDGDDVVIPKTTDAWRTALNTGKGNDTVFMLCGNVQTGEGDDIIDIRAPSTGCSAQVTGGSGSDTYIYRVSQIIGNTIQILEDINDGTSRDRLILPSVNSSAVVSLTTYFDNLGGETLVLTLPNRERIEIMRYFNASGEPNNTIEEIEFADGEIWDTKKVIALLKKA